MQSAQDATDIYRGRISSLDAGFRPGSHDVYTPTSTDTMGIQTPESGSSCGMAYSTPQAPFGVSQALGDTGLPDVTAMMFPSSNPFAYPNQPMITLEDQQARKQEHSFGPVDSGPLYHNASVNSNHPYDNLEVQCYDPLPPYRMPGQQPGLGTPNVDGAMDPHGMSREEGVMAMNSGAGLGWVPQQPRSNGMNIDDLFGEEWKGGWVEQGFRQ